MNTYCEARGCDRETVNGATFCESHRKQVQRNGRTTELRERLSPFGRFLEAALALADADAENDAAFHAARVRARSAAKGWICTSCVTGAGCTGRCETPMRARKAVRESPPATPRRARRAQRSPPARREALSA